MLPIPISITKRDSFFSSIYRISSILEPICSRNIDSIIRAGIVVSLNRSVLSLAVAEGRYLRRRAQNEQVHHDTPSELPPSLQVFAT